MSTIQIQERPVYADAACLKLRYCPADESCLLLYRMPAGGFSDYVEVFGDPANGCYEWAYRDDSGKITKHSDDGYGSTSVAMRDGLAWAHGDPDTDTARDAINALRLFIAADCRNGFGASIQEKDPEAVDEHDAVYLNALAAAGKAIAAAEVR